MFYLWEECRSEKAGTYDDLDEVSAGDHDWASPSMLPRVEIESILTIHTSERVRSAKLNSGQFKILPENSSGTAIPPLSLEFSLWLKPRATPL